MMKLASVLGVLALAATMGAMPSVATAATSQYCTKDYSDGTTHCFNSMKKCDAFAQAVNGKCHFKAG